MSIGICAAHRVPTRSRSWQSGLAILTVVFCTTLGACGIQAAVAPAWPLNDTGIDWWTDGVSNLLPAPPVGYPGQDASHGRDAAHDDDSDGHAGFSFTKLSSTGAALPASATAWSCVRDNVTGLVWEIKTDDGGLRDRRWTYSWYNPDATRNGGYAGALDRGSCAGGIRCDTLGYTQAVNQAGLCGARDWRLPSRKELKSIVDHSRHDPAIDNGYFSDPDLHGWYWSSSPHPGISLYASGVNFRSAGLSGIDFRKYEDHQVRLVRGGQASSFDPPPPSATLGPSGGASNPSGSAADPVNTATGNYFYIRDDLTLPGRGIGLTFTRTYNAQDPTDGPLGRGWTHAYLFRLTENPDGSVVIRHGDGHESFYDRSAASVYRARYPGVYDRLVKPAAGTFVLTAKDRTSRTFVNGRMTQLADRHGNTLRFSYDGAGMLTGITDSVGRQVTLTYDASGRLLQLAGPPSRTVRFAYDADGNLVSDTDPAGGVQRYSYDAERRLTRITNRRGQVLIDNVYDSASRVVAQTNGRGQITRFAYDSPYLGDTSITNPVAQTTIHRHDGQRRLIADISPLGHAVQYAYDAANNRLQVTDRNGRITRYTYDARGNVLTETDPMGAVTTLTYDANDQPLTRTDALGQVTAYSYDSAGNLLSQTDLLGQILIYTYDGYGQRLSRTDGNGHTTLSTYDALGNPTVVTNPLGQATQTAYDAAGRPISITDANGHATTFLYDGNDRLLSTTDDLGHTVAFAYDADGNRTRVTDAMGQTTVTAYDAQDNLLSVTDPSGAVTASTYDEADRRVTRTDPLGQITRYVYDAADRLISVADALGETTRYGYDPQGNQLDETNPLGQVITRQYDAANRLTRVLDPLGNTTDLGYDTLGRRTSQTDAEGRVTRYGYDVRDRLVRVTDPAGAVSEIMYDAVGNRLSVVNPKGEETRYSYDAADRLSTETDALGQVTAWQYDAAGNLTQRTDAEGQVTHYAYDAVDRLATIRYPNATTVTHSYDANGNRTRMVDPLGTSTFVYDEINRLTEQTDPYGNRVGHVYDAAGNRIRLVYPDSKTVTYGYDALNRLADVTDWLGNLTEYAYDAAGNLTDRVHHGNGTAGIYDYDAASRLIGIAEERADASVIASHALTLDAVGNRTAITSEDPVAPRYVSQNTTAVYDDADRLTHLGTVAVTHDGNGNLLTQPGGTYRYDAENRLILANGQSYLYDGQGNRLAATRGGVTTRYVLDLVAPLSQVLMERTVAGTPIAYYVHGLGLIARITPSGDTRHYHFDANGNTLALSDADGRITDAYAYSPFGELLGQTGSTPNPFRFLGQFGVQHEGNGLQYVRARYYHPATGRFISKDPLSGSAENGQTLNRYAYALNNPIRYVDVNGLSAREGGETRNELGSSDALHSAYLRPRLTPAEKERLLNEAAYYREQAAFYDKRVRRLTVAIGVTKLVAGVNAGAGVVVFGAAIAGGSVAVGTAASVGAAFVQLSAGVFSAGSSIFGGVGELSGWDTRYIEGMEKVGKVASIVNVFTSDSVRSWVLNLTQAAVDNF